MLINGDTGSRISKFNSNSVDLIIADIPWDKDRQGNFTYPELFAQFRRVLKPDHFCCVVVDTGSCISPFFEYSKSSAEFFQLHELMVFIEDGLNFGNILVLGDLDKSFIFPIRKVNYFIKPKGRHPNERDINLFRSLIEAYTKEGDSVLDPFMGVGNCGIACKELGRDFVGIEIDKDYFETAKESINS